MRELDDGPFLIPRDVVDGVHNYCNRWCERCRFRARCTVFVNAHPQASEAQHVTPFEPPADETPLMKELEAAGAFEEPTRAEMAAWERRHEEARRRVACEPALQLVEAYQTAADVALGEIGPPEGSEPADVIRWHHYLVQAKAYRALHGKIDEWFDADDLESDAYGSAKVALIAMDDMMAAWLGLAEQSKAVAEIAEAMALLVKARDALETALPRARQFVRPGFDTIPP
jgi:hypothetical protein